MASGLFRNLLGSGLIALLFLGASVPEAAAGSRKLKPGDVPPEMIWTTTSGDSLDWSDLRDGHPLVMVFWATWCAVCKKTWPELKELAVTYADAPRSPAWAAVSLGEPVKKVIPVAAKRGLPGTILVDPDETNGKRLGIQYVPTACVLDANGTVVYFGPAKPKKINRLLSTLTLATD